MMNEGWLSKLLPFKYFTLRNKSTFYFSDLNHDTFDQRIGNQTRNLTKLSKQAFVT